MRKTTLIVYFLLSIGICSPFLVVAALQVQDYQGVAYVTGGIGIEEREALKAIEGEFNLKLRFATKTGSYVGAIQVLIQDEQGNTVLEAVSDGPWFYADLKPGGYIVMASDANRNLQQKVQVQQRKLTELIFRFEDI